MPYVHAAMPCWVPIELRQVPSIESEPPTFIGSADQLRHDLLGRALSIGAEFVIRGPGWMPQADASSGPSEPTSIGRVLKHQVDLVRQHGWRAIGQKIEGRLRPLSPAVVPQSKILGPIFGAEYARVTREAIVTIGVNRVPTPRRSPRRPLVYSRLRDIEAPMLGACYLTEWTPGLEHLYELGTEIECYRTAEELTSKLTEIRQDFSRRSALRSRAQGRALAHHTVGRSIERIRAHFSL